MQQVRINLLAVVKLKKAEFDTSKDPSGRILLSDRLAGECHVGGRWGLLQCPDVTGSSISSKKSRPWNSNAQHHEQSCVLVVFTALVVHCNMHRLV